MRIRRLWFIIANKQCWGKCIAANKNLLIGFFCLFCGVLANATVGIFIRHTDVSVASAAFFRFCLSLPFCAVYLLWSKCNFCQILKKISKQEVFILFLASLCFFSGIVCANLSFRLTTIVKAELLGNLLPFTVIPIMWLVYGYGINCSFGFSVLVTIIGVVLVFQDKLASVSWDFMSFSTFTGDVLAFSVSVLYGIYLVIIHQIGKKYDSMFIFFSCSFMAAVMAGIYLLLVSDSGNLLPQTMGSFWSLVGLSYCSHLLGAGLILYGVTKVSPALSSVVVVSQPIIGSLYGAYFFSETLTLFSILGCMVAGIGIVFAKISHMRMIKC